ncbi:MAG TPA: AAA domain-containing protein [Ktedonobacterales bacterium]
MSAEIRSAEMRRAACGVHPNLTEALSCFLCALGPRPCDVASVEGRIAAVWERTGAAREGAVLLLCADGDRAYVSLNIQARGLVRDLARLAPSRYRELHLRVFHLEHASHDDPADLDGASRPRADADEIGLPRGDIVEGFESPDGSEARHSPARILRRLRATPLSVTVLEPDLLLNITDINNAEYCVRQYPLRRLVPSPPTPATLRGKLVHHAFAELLKSGIPDVAMHLHRALDAELTDLALRQISHTQAAADAEPHLRALVSWYASQRQNLWGNAPSLRAETFLLAPEIGLRGRLDFLLQDAHGGSLLELKTGEVRGQLPKREHRWQVYGYQTLLAARRPHDQSRPGATLLYSGTPAHAEAYGIPFTLRDLHRVVELRNALALISATGAAPKPPGGNTCARCMLRRVCVRASTLLGWEAPPSEEPDERFSPEDVATFASNYELLRLEARAAEAEARQLWRLPAQERCTQGIALGGLRLIGEPLATESGEWEYTFACEQTSELRENDAILLSDGDPVRGAAVTGTILRLGAGSVTVWTREPLAQPALIDRYESAMVHDRTVRNLWRWLDAEPRLRALVNGSLAPAFDDEDDAIEAPPILNPEQRRAVSQALSARDFLLIQGPPGTGKTSVVAEIARQCVARGERVLLAGFTNQAVDNVLRRLAADGMRDLVRLGHELSVAEELRPFRLVARAGEPHPLSPSQGGKGPHGEMGDKGPLGEIDDVREAEGASSFQRGELESGSRPSPEALREVLLRSPLVASTAATWASEAYDEAGEPLRFDLALVDEATQLTVPALLGILRFARRFVLVGDDKQLPALVRSEEAAARGLRESLFSRLLQQWGEAASVALVRQYRMHPAICGFPSAEFYGGALVAAGEARSAQLALDLPVDDPCMPVLDPARPLVFVDVRDFGGVPASKASRLQAEVVRRLVAALLRGGVAADEIGVIAPYRAQVALIRQRLATSGAQGVSVDTVDRFQGAERQVILLALGGTAARVSGGADFLSDPHRLNVALTRAQRKLLIIGDRRRMEASPLLRRLYEYCRTLYEDRGGIATLARSNARP